MGKLALIGATLLGFAGSPAVTPHQARQAIVEDAVALPTSQIACVASGRTQVCQISDATTYTDAVIGPARIVGTTIVRVSRGRHGYEVRVVIPDRFDIYGN